jgi:hypothetical protein
VIDAPLRNGATEMAQQKWRNRNGATEMAQQKWRNRNGP